MHQLLLIEDNPADQETIRLYLKEANFRHQLHLAESLSEGIARAAAEPVDLVLLDLSLRDSNGFRTLSRFQEAAGAVPVVVLTGYNNNLVGMQAVRAGAQDFLVKGEFDGRRLASSIRFAIERFRAQASLQKTAEELLHAEQRIRDVQRLAQVAHWEMDIVNNSMSWSEEMFRILGHKPNSFAPTRSDYLHLVHVEDRMQVINFFERVTQTGDAEHIEHRVLINNRKVKQLSLRARIMFDEKANKILLLGSIQEVSGLTGQKEDEAESPMQPVADEKNTASSPLSRISFNIRSPLCSVTHLLYLLEQTRLNDEQADLVNNLKSAVDDINLVMGQLLRYSLLSEQEETSLSLTNIELGDLLESVQRLIRFGTGSQQIEWKQHALPRVVLGDADRIGLMLYSLLEKVQVLADEGAHIRVILNGVEQEGRFRLHFQVEYSGESFDWPRESAGMSGNGPQVAGNDHLANLNSILCILSGQLGATTDCRNRPNRLTTVDLFLPVEAIDQPQRNLPRSPLHPVNLLLVEDHPLQQIAIRKVMANWSDQVKVQLAGDGQAAIEEAARASYDIILMDLQLPRLSGLEASKTIKSRMDVPIIALTAGASLQEEKECRAAGMDDYLPKPFRPEDLQVRIMQLLRQNGHHSAR